MPQHGGDQGMPGVHRFASMIAATAPTMTSNKTTVSQGEPRGTSSGRPPPQITAHSPVRNAQEALHLRPELSCQPGVERDAKTRSPVCCGVQPPAIAAEHAPGGVVSFESFNIPRSVRDLMPVAEDRCAHDLPVAHACVKR